MSASALVSAITTHLAEHDDGTLVLVALSGLTDVLLSGAPGQSGFAQPAEWLPALVATVRDSLNPTVVLLAARALALLLDVLPAASPTAVRLGSVEALMGRLAAIEYVDVAEVAIGALERLAEAFPERVLSGPGHDGANGLMVLLSYLDFFSAVTQRKAAAAAAHACRGLTAATFPLGLDAAPLLTNLLTNADAAVVESALRALLRVVASLHRRAAAAATEGGAARGSLAAHGETVDRLASNGLPNALLALLSSALPANAELNAAIGATAAAPSTVTLALKLAAMLCRGSVSVCAALLEAGL